MTNNKHRDEILTPQQLLYYNQSCSRLVTHFDDKPEILTYYQISPDIFFFADKLSYGNKVNEAQSNWFVLKEATSYKRGVQY